MIEVGQSVLVTYGKYKGVTGSYKEWSGHTGWHIILVPSFTIPDQLVEIALRDGEFEVLA